MRGDSLRDLYAKTLALLGLGVLAGTGALVDYWPAGIRLPVIETGLPQPELSLALAVPEQVEPQLRVASARRAVQRLPAVSPAVDLAALIPEPRFELSEPMNGDLIQTVAFSRPAVLVPMTFADQDSAAPIGQEVSLSEPTVTRTDSTESTLVMSSAAPVALAADEPGMISGVVRATKSSLLLTGRKTGASIVSAFRVVSGAVKKALPN
jgi:hypothetical protein